MITKHMNKWMFTFCKCNCHSFPLYLPYAKLTLYSTRHIQISNDAKLIWQMVHTRTSEDPILDIPEGFAGCGHGQARCGNAPPPSPCPLVSLEQLLATQNDFMRRLVENTSNLETKIKILHTWTF
jgi:hypothetical protein